MRNLAWSIVFFAVAACGARTELIPGRPAGGGGSTSSSTTASTSAPASSSTGLPCTDQECDDGIECTKDACGPGGCTHEPDATLCSDGIFCTIDQCDPVAGCVHTFSDAVCDDGIACTSDVCDKQTDSCHHAPCDGMCDDGVFCNGVERCDETLGCTSGPPTCDLMLGCSMDSCQEGAKTCTHAGAGICAPSVQLVVTDVNGALRGLNPYTGTTTLIASQANNLTHLDIAILGGRWFTVDSTVALELVPFSNVIKKILPAIGSANSLGAGPDGMLYAADTQVYRVDPDSGSATVIGSLPPGQSSSGDIAFLGDRMFVSTDGPCGGTLVQFDPMSGTGQVIGGDGLGCVYGLAVKAGILYVLNCDGAVGTFDPTTGQAHILSTTNLTVYGADTLP